MKCQALAFCDTGWIGFKSSFAEGYKDFRVIVDALAMAGIKAAE